MKRILFQLNSAAINMEICAYFEKGELVIEGYETGYKVQEWLGDHDYEYSIILPEQSVSELRNILNLNPFARKDLLEHLSLKFNDVDCFTSLKEFLHKHLIQYKEYSWA